MVYKLAQTKCSWLTDYLLSNNKRYINSETETKKDISLLDKIILYISFSGYISSSCNGLVINELGIVLPVEKLITLLKIIITCGIIICRDSVKNVGL